MSKIHPTQNKNGNIVKQLVHDACPSVFTVWKKSSMSFQCTDGFTVFNSEGSLVFRVDNYSRKSPLQTEGLVLMDGVGRALLTLRPQVLNPDSLLINMSVFLIEVCLLFEQILSMQYQWNGFKGEENGCRKNPVFSMRRRSILLQRNSEIEVFMGGSTNNITAVPDFMIEGSFRRRRCRIRRVTGEVIALISRKNVINTTIMLSDDVFTLTVQPGFECKLIMAFVMVMDRICKKPFSPVLCS
ncbi:hypothetical protein GIB67_042007 [Kingdonia uniflora]|uniref:Uncharacterized protein n=1 Tax=Kingdonia uniflora TaxID=39325 RepID=A0A7J7P0G6_9MAGN|nr:hypothetical protein GIB67_042007 [Kingdonia uniflora]